MENPGLPGVATAQTISAFSIDRKTGLQQQKITAISLGESSMKMKSPYAFGLAIFLALSIAIPADLWAAPQERGVPPWL